MAIAIVHDYLTQRGGAERVLLAIVRAFPSAPVHTSLYDPAGCFPSYRDVQIHTSPLNRVSLLRRRHRLAFPLLAPAFSATLVDADVTLVSSSGWAHGVRTSGRKIVYCHAPARWLYQRERYLAGRGPMARASLSLCERRLRHWDQTAASTAERYLVNSTAIRDQVQRVYGIEADVLHPPVAVDVDGERVPLRRLPTGYVLCVARLQRYKNVHVVVGAMRQLPDAHLVVVGDGPQRDELNKLAPSNVTLLGEVTDAQLRWLYANASALVGASYEDFGLTPIEAAAFGVPTVALRFGGYLDTVRNGVTGVLFETATPISLAASLSTALERRWDRATLIAHAGAFSEQQFARRLRSLALGRPVARRRPALHEVPRALSAP